jgi:predicted GTPase
MIIGKEGSGKSALINAILNEMILKKDSKLNEIEFINNTDPKSTNKIFNPNESDEIFNINDSNEIINSKDSNKIIINGTISYAS